MAAKVVDSVERETMVKAPIEKVYDALIKPEKFVQWWKCTMEKGTLKVGEVTVCDFGAMGKCAYSFGGLATFVEAHG